MKIILVHGTFGEDPQKFDTGDKWWQKGSEFTQYLKNKIPFDIEIIPFHWDGKNSERSRQNYGLELHKKLEEIRSNDEQCEIAIISHSHGGNVVLHSFRACAAKGRQSARNVVKWISVGTPFFKTRNILLSAFNISAIMIPFIVLSFSLYFFGQKFGEIGTYISILLLASLIIIFLIATFIRFIKESSTKKHLNAYIGGKLTIISHSEDEAINALSNVDKIPASLTPAGFFMQPIAVILMTFLTIMVTFEIIGPQPVNTNMFILVELIEILKNIETTAFTIADPIFANFQIGQFTSAFSLVVVLLISTIISWPICQIIGFLISSISSIFSNVSNYLLKKKLTAAVYGWDIPYITVANVVRLPSSDELEKTLPPQAEAKIIKNCEREIIQSSKEIRSLIAMIGLGEATFESAIKEIKNNKWKFLVHNQYFYNLQCKNIIVEELKR